MGKNLPGLKWLRMQREVGSQIPEASNIRLNIRLLFWKPVALGLMEYLESQGFWITGAGREPRG